MASKKETPKKENMNQEKKKSALYLGDPKFYSNLFKYYEWFFSGIAFLMGCVFLFDGAFLPGAIILIISSFNLPPVKKLTAAIPKFVRILINLVLIYLFITSIGLSL
jgi:hypothetical protein